MITVKLFHEVVTLSASVLYFWNNNRIQQLKNSKCYGKFLKQLRDIFSRNETLLITVVPHQHVGETIRFPYRTSVILLSTDPTIFTTVTEVTQEKSSSSLLYYNKTITK